MNKIRSMIESIRRSLIQPAKDTWTGIGIILKILFFVALFVTVCCLGYFALEFLVDSYPYIRTLAIYLLIFIVFILLSYVVGIIKRVG